MELIVILNRESPYRVFGADHFIYELNLEIMLGFQALGIYVG